MATGKVKWFNNAKGYGFITTEEGKDAFVHYTDLDGEEFKRLDEGDDVQFEVCEGPKGAKATKVVKLT